MKKIMVALLLSAVVATPAFAADTGWYAGVDYGSANQGNAGTAGITYSGNVNSVGGVQVGYQFDKNWGAEFFYTGAGKQHMAVTATPTVNYADMKSDAWGFDAVGTLPFNDSFSAFAKLGIASVKSTVSAVGTLQTAGLTGDSRVDGTYGAGLQYNPTQAIGIRLGVDVYGVKTHDNTVTYNTNSTVTSLGLVFKF